MEKFDTMVLGMLVKERDSRVTGGCWRVLEIPLRSRPPFICLRGKEVDLIAPRLMGA